MTLRDSGKTPPEGTWSAYGVSGRNGGVTVGGDEAKWSPLALWIAEQIKQGVRPIPLPALSELLTSISRGNQVDYRFGHLAPMLSGPRESQ